MQIFDRRWMRLVEEAGMKLRLYMRYMDDGRKLLQPFMKGLRWGDGSLTYCLKWEKEDQSRTPIEVTMAVLKGTVEGVAGTMIL